MNDPSRVMTKNLARHKYKTNQQKKTVSKEKQINNSMSQNQEVFNESEADMNTQKSENECVQPNNYFLDQEETFIDLK